MGTNYYLKTEKCETCGHKEEGLHLGKSSMGWQFSFQYNGGQYYKNVEEMKEWLKDKKIENEYGEEVSYAEFWEMIENKQKPDFKNHAEEVSKTNPSYARGIEFIINGYSFTDTSFS